MKVVKIVKQRAHYANVHMNLGKGERERKKAFYFQYQDRLRFVIKKEVGKRSK